LEKAMEDWMVRTNDPLLEVFRKRDDAAFREAFITKTEEGTTPRRKKAKAKAKGKSAAPSPAPAPPAQAKQADLVQLHLPEMITPGQKATVKITHTLPESLGEKSLQVTLKGANNERIERKSLKISGKGEAEVTFDIPADLPGGKVIFAALVGESIKDALQHIQSKPVEAK
jgi:N-sulfoglucosamine sulfohydrolase